MIANTINRKFILAPQLFRKAAEQFAGLEHTFSFYRLVGDYLPEEKEKLMGIEVHEALREFIKLFSKKYFPLREMSSLDIFTNRIPVRHHAMGRFEYDNNIRGSGHLLAAAICVCPFPDRPGARVAVVDRFLKKVERAAELLPGEGWEQEEVERALEGSPYEGLPDWCRWIFGRTGNRFLDTGEWDDWDIETVKTLARDWPLYLEADARMKNFNKWLDKDFEENSLKVINYLRKKIGRKPKKLVDIFEGDTGNG